MLEIWDRGVGLSHTCPVPCPVAQTIDITIFFLLMGQGDKKNNKKEFMKKTYMEYLYIDLKTLI